jgi:hypothetical protein
MSKQSRDQSVYKDPDMIVTQLLEQFHSTTSRTTPINTSKASENAPPLVHQSTGSPKDAEPSFEIVIPAAENPENYAYLPGHFEAHCILAADMHETKFIVRLKSGERTTVSERS